MRKLRWALGALCVLGGLGLPVGAAASVPAGFVGVNLAGPELDSHQRLSDAFDRMARIGVQSVRVAFSWAQAQPYPDWAHVPLTQVGDFQPYKVPTTFARSDEVVELAAEHHITVMPLVLYAPYWDQLERAPAGTFAVPRSDRPYGAYMSLLVKRYGPTGSFWRAHPALPRDPITMWQIWNEPNLYEYWPTRAPFARRYVALVRAARTAIKRADPSAKIVLGGLTNYSWVDLESIYKAGGRGLFDVVALHPYTKDPQGVITILDLARQVMDRNHDRHAQLLLTELGWPSAANHTFLPTDFDTTEVGQARKIAQVLPMLARHARQLGLAGFYYYDWESTDTTGDPWAYSGLLALRDGRVVQKPAYRAFRRAVRALES